MEREAQLSFLELQGVSANYGALEVLTDVSVSTA